MHRLEVGLGHRPQVDHAGFLQQPGLEIESARAGERTVEILRVDPDDLEEIHRDRGGRGEDRDHGARFHDGIDGEVVELGELLDPGPAGGRNGRQALGGGAHGVGDRLRRGLLHQ